MPRVKDIPRRILKKVYLYHKDMRAVFEERGFWRWKTKNYVIKCQCGWVSQDKIDVMRKNQFDIANEIQWGFDNHIKAEARKLGWKPKY